MSGQSLATERNRCSVWSCAVVRLLRTRGAPTQKGHKRKTCRKGKYGIDRNTKAIPMHFVRRWRDARLNVHWRLAKTIRCQRHGRIDVHHVRRLRIRRERLGPRVVLMDPRRALDAVLNRDGPMVIGVTLVSASSVVIATAAIDLFGHWLHPLARETSSS